MPIQYTDEYLRRQDASDTVNWATALRQVVTSTEDAADSFRYMNQALGEMYARPVGAREYAPRNQRVALRRKFGKLAYNFYFRETAHY